MTCETNKTDPTEGEILKKVVSVRTCCTDKVISTSLTINLVLMQKKTQFCDGILMCKWTMKTSNYHLENPENLLKQAFSIS